jgi:hypothetical protein
VSLNSAILQSDAITLILSENKALKERIKHLESLSPKSKDPEKSIYTREMLNLTQTKLHQTIQQNKLYEKSILEMSVEKERLEQELEENNIKQENIMNTISKLQKEIDDFGDTNIKPFSMSRNEDLPKEFLEKEIDRQRFSAITEEGYDLKEMLEMQETIGELQKQLEEKNEVIQQLQEQIKGDDMEIDGQQIYETHSTECFKLNERICELEEENKKKEDELAHFSKKLEKNKSSFDKKMFIQKEEVQKLAKALDLERQENSRLQKEVDNLKQNIIEFENPIEKIYNTTPQDAEIDNLQKIIYELKSLNFQMQSKLTSLRIENSRLHSSLSTSPPSKPPTSTTSLNSTLTFLLTKLSAHLSISRNQTYRSANWLYASAWFSQEDEVIRV